MSTLIPESFIVTIQLFGAFRNFSNSFGNASHVEINCGHPCSIAEIRVAFKQRLQECCPLFDASLLAHSVFANENSILPETTLINQSTQLVILPPTSGG